MSAHHALLLGTCDTKLEELLFLKGEIERYDVKVTLIDVGRTLTKHEAITISQSKLLQVYSDGKDISHLPRNQVLNTMANCATQQVQTYFHSGDIHAIVSAGGSCGTSLAAQVMRDALPIGFPKMIVSTVASGHTGPIVGETDITMVYSVVDIAGLNQVLRNVLSNAGAAVAGMARAYASRLSTRGAGSQKKRVGITMFGVTTPAVDAIRKHLESGQEVETYIFHATGHGGRAMERLIREGQLDAVLDLTTTEICDYLTGGVMSAGEHRLEAAAKAGIPNVVSVGATDMTNFGPKSTVPERYKDRNLYEHNPVVTLMRTSKDEARRVGEFLTGKLTSYSSDVEKIEVWLPMGGVSLLSTPGGPYEDREADHEMFEAIRRGLEGSGIKIVEDKRAINDQGLAHDIAEALLKKMGISRNTS
ncbi:hypothetical protein N656DRAFT_744876 [Canariomyces notabilis]|uniref:Uncharacterized protein n=1 Tax=Canariomyces notabilis TaxID=2074819 RepID=A0AAN6TKK0_9PEZI|nr:hypothetical protein N656DRAFT_744876 [Canariomyces arenarius]